MRDTFQLQDEVTEHAFGFQLASTVLDVQPSFVGYGKLAGHVGIGFPALQVFAVEEGIEFQRL